MRLSPRFSVEKAHRTQLRLSGLISREDELPEAIRHLAGVDVAHAGGVSIGAAVVLDFDSLSPVESQTAHTRTRFPYVPTLLSFREIPPALSALRKLRVRPDVVLVDGQGVAHPYRLGFASHLGLVAGVPTIGVAKSLLCGEAEPIGGRRWAPILEGGEVIGAVVVTRPGVKPVYVSVGHRVSLERAVEITLRCTRGFRLPEPTRRAHALAEEEKRRLRTAEAGS